MRFQFLTLFLTVFISNHASSQDRVALPTTYSKSILEELSLFYSPSEGQTEDLLKGDVISVSKVNSVSTSQQQLMLFISGIHPRNCQRAMRKLSLYENYHSYISFIKQSAYDEKNEKVSFVIDHSLLPFPMSLSFKIPRITKEGHYPFTFEGGFLNGLKGTIIVSEIGKFCLLGMKTDWQGTKTRIPNYPFELFLQTAGKLGLEHLIRISLF